MKSFTTLFLALVLSGTTVFADCASDYNAALQAANDAYATCKATAESNYNTLNGHLEQIRDAAIQSITNDNSLTVFQKAEQINLTKQTYRDQEGTARATRDATIADCLATGLAAYKAAHQAYAECLKSERVNSNEFGSNITENNELIQNLFPNPVYRFVSFVYNSNSTSEITINVFDMFGRSVMTIREPAMDGEQQFDLNLPELSKGVYFMEIKNKATISQTKFIVQ